MTVYVDVVSFGQTEALARCHVEMRQLGGTMLFAGDRERTLIHLRPGDRVVCRPSALPFWRGAVPGVVIDVAEEPPYEDDPSARISDWLVWGLMQGGLTKGEGNLPA